MAGTAWPKTFAVLLSSEQVLTIPLTFLSMSSWTTWTSVVDGRQRHTLLPRLGLPQARPPRLVSWRHQNLHHFPLPPPVNRAQAQEARSWRRRIRPRRASDSAVPLPRGPQALVMVRPMPMVEALQMHPTSAARLGVLVLACALPPQEAAPLTSSPWAGFLQPSGASCDI